MSERPTITNAGRSGKSLDVPVWECGICGYAVASFQVITFHLMDIHNREIVHKDGKMTIRNGDKI